MDNRMKRASIELLIPLLLVVLLPAGLAAPTNLNAALNRLQSEEPNYFVIAIPQELNSRDGDDIHTEFYLSIKYPFDIWQGDRWYVPNRFNLIYNGLYDFYVIDTDRYDSAPIVSRRQNPGFTFDWATTEKGLFRLGYFHESNGQTLDTDDGAVAFDQEAAQGGQEYALAKVSRGWDYLRMNYTQLYGSTDDLAFMWQIEFRYFLEKQMFSSKAEEDIFWDPTYNGPVGIQEFDGLRMQAEVIKKLPFFGHSSARLETKMGTSDWEALGHFSARASINMWDVFTLFYFDGYGKEPSTYHLRTQYFGIGIEVR
jgi:hypothetical protein